MGSIPISLKEFRGFVFNELDGYYSEEVAGNEIAFDQNIGKGYTLRILTSIPKGGETVRREGDAIRVLLIDPDDEAIEFTPHVKRTPGYRERIQDRINELIGCAECESEMRASISEYGPYLFCREDSCSYTENL